MLIEVFNVYGFLMEFFVLKFLFNEIVVGFFEFVGELLFVIYNVVFDMVFFNVEFCWDNCDVLKNEIIDILGIVWKKFLSGLNLFDVLCWCFNIDVSSCYKYGVFIDVEFLVEVYLELIGGC